MIAANNFAPCNAGIIFWTDVLLPVIGFGLWWWRHGRASQDSPRNRVAAS